MPALPSLALRHHSGHATAPVSRGTPIALKVAKVVASQALGPRLGADVLDLVEAGMKLVQDPVAFGQELFKDALGAGLSGVGDWLGGLGSFGAKLDGILDTIDEWLAEGLLVWDLLKEFPVIGDYLRSAERFLDLALDSLFLELFGMRLDPNDPPRGDLACPGELPTAEAPIDWVRWQDIGCGEEVALRLQEVLEPLVPTIWHYADDSLPVDWDYFEEHCSRGPTRDERSWRVEEAYARNPERPRSRAPYPYMAAYKLTDRRILVELGFLRMGSFYPWSSPSAGYLYEHQGDGERLYLVVQVDPVGDALTAKATLIGVIGTGHGERWAYAWRHLRTGPDGRILATISRGSHATGILSGLVQSGNDGLLNFFGTECYPDPDDDDCAYGSSVNLPVDDDQDGTHALKMVYGSALYYETEGWGDDPEIHWGDETTFVGVSSGYKAWDGAPDSEIVAKAMAFDLLDNTSASPTCPNGPTCPTCAAKEHPAGPESAGAWVSWVVWGEGSGRKAEDRNDLLYTG